MEKNNQKTCFVIIGFGQKKDYPTKRVLDLDKTFRIIIKPVFEELGYLCYRANDIIRSGIADVKMYENILKADFVIADLSTLNPNVMYELGIRHALRPFTTIVIAENKLKDFPFDINHVIVEKYEHLEKGIDAEEAERFRSILKKKILKLETNLETDSPVYTFIKYLKPPVFEEEEIENIKSEIEQTETLAKLLEKGESAKNADDFLQAKEFFAKAYKIQSNDPFIIQRYALSIYQSKQPNEVESLYAAQLIIDLLEPDSSTDPETLGIAGSINKKLYHLLNERIFLEKAIQYYERGFVIKQDHYNGINAAFLYTVNALNQKDTNEAYADYGNGRRIRKKVVEECSRLIRDNFFEQNPDNIWVVQSLAQAYLGLEMEKELNEITPLIEKYSKGKFDLRVFEIQNKELVDAIRDFKTKYE